MNSLRLTVIVLPFSLLVAAVVASFVDLDAFITTAKSINQWTMATFEEVFSYAGLLFVLTCLWAFFSPLGKIRIGGPEAKPLLSLWSWFSITLCTTIAIGILFWGTAEPMYHLANPGGTPLIKPNSDEASRFALTSLFMHWTFTPYAIYTVPGLTFALAFYNFGKTFSLAGPLSILFRRPIQGAPANFLDAIALLTVAYGLAASLGMGSLSLAGGIGHLTDIGTSPLMLAVITLMIIIAFVISSVTGLHRGIRVLSAINTKFFFAFALFFFLFGPTWELLVLGFKGLSGYVQEFFPRSLLMEEKTDTVWVQGWTVFYWANWLAWAPLTAIFLGKIARGYSVRAFIVVNFFAPALFSMAWMTIFGGTALYLDMSEAGFLQQILNQQGPEAVLYTILERYPMETALSVLLVGLSFISYVTAADSNTDAIASICQTQVPDTPAARRQTLLLKVIWASLIGLTAWILTSFAGTDGFRILSTIGGLPALFIVIAMNITLIVMGTRERHQLYRSENNRPTTDV